MRLLNQVDTECRRVNHDGIAVSLAPGGATANHGKIAPQRIQEFI
jgi:hypothetical protein